MRHCCLSENPSKLASRALYDYITTRLREENWTFGGGGRERGGEANKFDHL